jgi:hypothetical protein
MLQRKRPRQKDYFGPQTIFQRGEQIPTFSISQRLKIALGGFVSFTGLLVLACAMLALTGAANLASLFQGELSVVIPCAIGALDVACGLILVLSDKEIALSFASYQDKTSNDAD